MMSNNNSIAVVFVALLSILVYSYSNEDVCTSDYPPQYIVYKLQSGEKITLDGKIDEQAWKVSEMSDLKDLSGGDDPYRKTWVAMRYDDTCLYVGAVLEEPQAWANHTEENTPIFHDNDFEIFIDPAGEYRYYKELEISAINVRWNLLMVRPYVDGGPAVCNSTQQGLCSKTDPEHGVEKTFDIRNTWKSATYVEGKVNDPNVGSKYWSLEMCIPLKDMLLYSKGDYPKHNVIWMANTMRVQYRVHTEHSPNGTAYYAKDSNNPYNWAWCPTNGDTVHLPDRWGYLQFSEDKPGTTKILSNPSFTLRKVLSAVYEAEHVFAKTHSDAFTDSLLRLSEESTFPKPYLKCVSSGSLHITVDKKTFIANATSVDGSLSASITNDRHFTLIKN